MLKCGDPVIYDWNLYHGANWENCVPVLERV